LINSDQEAKSGVWAGLRAHGITPREIKAGGEMWREPPKTWICGQKFHLLNPPHGNLLVGQRLVARKMLRCLFPPTNGAWSPHPSADLCSYSSIAIKLLVLLRKCK
jgi:hypothetical protein